MKDEIIKVLKNQLEATVHRHRLNVEILMSNTVGVAEHPDVMETIAEELDKMAECHDRLEMLETYF